MLALFNSYEVSSLNKLSSTLLTSDCWNLNTGRPLGMPANPTSWRNNM